MTESFVRTSMRDENHLGCSYAIISKAHSSVIVILKETECGIFDYHQMQEEETPGPYLLLKHYDSCSEAYRDFLKLIGKMCKKNEDSKYFRNHVQEENRMVSKEGRYEYRITAEETAGLQARLSAFQSFVLHNRERFV